MAGHDSLKLDKREVWDSRWERLHVTVGQCEGPILVEFVPHTLPQSSQLRHKMDLLSWPTAYGVRVWALKAFTGQFRTPRVGMTSNGDVTTPHLSTVRSTSSLPSSADL